MPQVPTVALNSGRDIPQLGFGVYQIDIVFPKSTTPSRIRENFPVFDFELGDDDLTAITALDRGEDGRTGPHPDTFDDVPGQPGS